MPIERVDFKHVRENAAFEPVLAHYDIAFDGKGDQKTALCCFHEEDTGSLKINLAKKVFHCFGCEAKGNVLDFVTLMEGGNPEEGKDLRKGALKLAELCGIDPVPRGGKAKVARKPRQGGQTDRKGGNSSPPREKPASEAPSACVGVGANKPLTFTLHLDPEHPYLATRGLKRETIDRFGVGHCNRGLMKGRIAIPIHNEKGELVAYAGRWAAQDVPADTPRYLLPEGFNKQSVLFNLNRAAQRSHDVHVTVICESYWSVMKLDELGHAAVSPMGHSVSEAHCALLKACGIRRVIVLFDGDEAGAKGLDQSFQSSPGTSRFMPLWSQMGSSRTNLSNCNWRNS